MLSYACHGVRDGHTRQARATIECTLSYACDGVRNGNARQARATRECLIFYAGDIIRYDKVFYFLAIQIEMMSIICRIRSIIIKFYLAPCRQICDMYRRQARATIEGIPSYACDGVRNSYTRQARTSLVFTTDYYSIFYR